MKTFLNFVKGLLKIGAQNAGAIVSAYNPALGSLVSLVLSAVVSAEAAVPGQGMGSVKDAVASIALTAGGDGIAAAFAAAGKPIKNPELFAAGVSKMQSGMVDILNATGENVKLPAGQAQAA